MSRGSEAAAPVAVILVELLQIHMHHPFRCCVAMRLRVETRDRCLSCARRFRSSSVEEIVDEFDCQSAGDESEIKSLLVVDESLASGRTVAALLDHLHRRVRANRPAMQLQPHRRCSLWSSLLSA
jgi:hypothetical protein